MSKGMLSPSFLNRTILKEVLQKSMTQSRFWISSFLEVFFFMYKSLFSNSQRNTLDWLVKCVRITTQSEGGRSQKDYIWSLILQVRFSSMSVWDTWNRSWNWDTIVTFSKYFAYRKEKKMCIVNWLFYDWSLKIEVNR